MRGDVVIEVEAAPDVPMDVVMGAVQFLHETYDLTGSLQKLGVTCLPNWEFHVRYLPGGPLERVYWNPIHQQWINESWEY